jgi:hypothetical protein
MSMMLLLAMMMMLMMMAGIQPLGKWMFATQTQCCD